MEKAGTPLIVVDTNIICYRWMASTRSSLAERLWTKDSEWIAPLLWRSEFRNVMAGAIRRRAVELDAAIEIVQKAEAQFAGREFLVAGDTILKYVAASRCSAYDCEFIALAQEKRTHLVTEDKELLRDFPSIATSLEKFARSA